MDPHSAAAAQVLARAYKQANRFADARRVADASIAEGKDLWLTHSILFQIAYAEGDRARMQADGQWGLTHLNSAMTLDDLGLAAATGGRLLEAMRDFKRAREESLRNGDQEYADGVLLDEASLLAEFGEGAKAVALLNEIKSPMGEPGDVVFHRVMAGDAVAGQRYVADAGANERDTVKVFIDLPLVKALLALEAHQPEEAVRLLEPAKPYDLRDFRVPYLRAQAESEAGVQDASYLEVPGLDAAAADYRLILEHRGVDPIAPVYSLAHLRLARVLVRLKQVDAAKAEYRALFDAWKSADADLPLLVEARAEYARL
jgi:tetratricopeptide (TPR) repeat protein